MTRNPCRRESRCPAHVYLSEVYDATAGLINNRLIDVDCKNTQKNAESTPILSYNNQQATRY